MSGPDDTQIDLTDQPEFVEVTDVYADLVGTTEIATGLGVTIHRVKRWIERRDTVGCPRPVAVLGLGHIYSLREWRAWFALWRITRGSETWNRRRPK